LGPLSEYVRGPRPRGVTLRGWRLPSAVMLIRLPDPPRISPRLLQDLHPKFVDPLANLVTQRLSQLLKTIESRGIVEFSLHPDEHVNSHSKVCDRFHSEREPHVLTTLHRDVMPDPLVFGAG
jgi:hypothetical protein